MIAVARLDSGTAYAVAIACVAASVPAGLRWLRVAQREHYLAGSSTRFAARWWSVTPVNLGLSAVAVAGAVLSFEWPLAGLATGAAVAAGPLGLSVRGRTAPLAWTRRLRTLAVIGALFELVTVAIGAAVGVVGVLAPVVVLATPALVDLACLATAPVERRLASRFVDQAAARLARIAPTVVAVTGSYGKTSTKNHIADLLSGSRSVMATPASFNNRAGLARAINEQLADGTEVFVAEMGTYGPGEIADLCRWCPPRISVITAIGPVHLERFGSEERIVEAKAEIAAPAADVVLCVDNPRLAALAKRLEAAGKHVVRCSSTDPGADVCVIASPGMDGPGMDTVSISVDGAPVAGPVCIPTGVQPGNLACAIGVARALGVPADVLADRVTGIGAVDHRLAAVRSDSGAIVLDDTYNSNPAGAAKALEAMARIAADRPDARTVVVTPGMVELGRCQRDENRRFGAAAASVATDFLVVGRTNRRALVDGATSSRSGPVKVVVTWMPSREAAVSWVRGRLGAGDVVLYENDLPDHYP